jgi:hypothetical protein
VNECGGEDRVTSTADDSGMGMAHGSEGEHQVKECGEDRVISTADDFGMGTGRGKEGVSVKNVVAVTLEMACERCKESALGGQTEMAATLEMACEHCKESALGGQTEILPLRWDQARHGKWNGGFLSALQLVKSSKHLGVNKTYDHTTSQIPCHLAYPKDRDQRILPQAPEPHAQYSTVMGKCSGDLMTHCIGGLSAC